MRVFTVAAATIGLIAWAFAAPAAADETTTEYYFGAAPKHTNLSFVSKTAVEEIVGSSNAIRGSAVVNWEAGTAKLELVVPVDSLRTGIAKRDEHLRSATWMDAERYPVIAFSGTAARTKDDAKRWTVTGTWEMHGASKKVSLTARVVRIPVALSQKAKFGDGEWIRVQARLPITITDFGIVIPGGVAPKMNKTWDVTLTLSATTAKPAGATPMAESEPAKVAAPSVKLNAPGTRYQFGLFPQNTNLTIESRTELETIITQTNVVGGTAAIEFFEGRGAVKMVVPVATLRTGIKLRDEHLRSPMWLDAEKFPTIEFVSTSATKAGDRRWRVEGDFTMHGVTKRIAVDVTVQGVPPRVLKGTGFDAKGKAGMHFRSTFTLKLSDFG
ncbi:MAG: YceI family protein, partial [Planctomycetota bacterium]